MRRFPSERLEMLTGAGLGLETLGDVAFLRLILRAIRKEQHLVRLEELILWHDPVDYIDWLIDQKARLERLSAALVSGNFRPVSPFVVRGAKSRGLSRPLSYLTIDDEISYRAVVEAAAASLLRNAPDFAHFGRSQRFRPAKGQSDEDPYEGWFERFLRREGALKTLTDKGEWVVESDIASFFQCINIDRVIAMVTERSSLDRDSIALLALILRTFVPSRRYANPGPEGLIQGNHDASRILAHIYIDLLDDALQEEGKAGRYSRWVDDVVVSVNDEREARQVISRIQLSVEALGLAPNATKTRFLRKSDWEQEHYPLENEYIDSVEKLIAAALPVREKEFLEQFRRFLARPPTRYYDRVLRRFFTTARAMASNVLQPYAWRLLAKQPSAARSILSYLSAFPLTTSRVEIAFGRAEEFGDVYEDLEILIIEYLLTSPNQNSTALKSQLVNLTKTRMMYLLKSNAGSAPYRAGILALLLLKFGTTQDLRWLLTKFSNRLPLIDHFVAYAFICLSALPESETQASRMLHGVSMPLITRMRDIVRSLTFADRHTVRSIRNYLDPISRRRPNRVTLRPRALPCLFLLARAPDVRREVGFVLDSSIARLRSSPESRRDRTAMAVLKSIRRSIPPV